MLEWPGIGHLDEGFLALLIALVLGYCANPWAWTSSPASVGAGATTSHPRGGCERDVIHVRLVAEAVSGKRFGGCGGRRRLGLCTRRGDAGARG